MWTQSFAVEVTLINECPFFEGIPLPPETESALRSGACNNCECIKNSFIETDISSLDQEVLATTGSLIAEGFKQEIMPKFVSQIKRFGELSPSCQLSRLENSTCQGGSTYQSMVRDLYSLYYNRTDTPNIGLNGEIPSEKLSCFPMQTIIRNYENNEFMNELKKDEKGHISSSNFIAGYLSQNNSDYNLDQSYDELVENLKKESDFGKFVEQECDQFFEQVETVFCEKPKSLLGHEKNKEFLNFDRERRDFFQNATFRELELFTINCHEEKCVTERSLPFCQNREENKGYDPKKMFGDIQELNNQGLYKEFLINTANQADQFCPLLRCESYDEALDSIFDGIECKEKTPPRTVAELKSYCQELSAVEPETICAEEPLAGILEAYLESDEPFRVDSRLLAGKKAEDLELPELKEILTRQGLSTEEIEQIGDWGVYAAFDLDIPFAPSTNEEPLTPAQIAGQRQAQQLILANAEEINSREEARAQEASRERPSFSERQLKARERTVEAISSVAAKPRETIITDASLAMPNRSSSYFSPEIGDFSEANRSQASGPTVEREREEIMSEMASIEEEIRRMASSARETNGQIAQEESERSLSGLSSQLESLRGELARANQDRAAGTTRTNRRERSPVSNSDGDIRERLGQDSPFSDSTIASAGVTDAVTSGRGSGAAGRSPASSGGQSDPALIAATLAARNPSLSGASAYFESRTQDLPMLSIEDLGQVTIGEEFVLGIREGGELSRVRLVPETVNGEVRYSLVLLDPLSDSAKISLAQSPFVRRFVLEDSVQSVIGVRRRSLQHQGLKEILLQN